MDPAPASYGSAPGAGHRTVPHTADLIIEAWAPTEAGCLEEAVQALVETFAAPDPVAARRPVPLELTEASRPDLLVALIEEVIYRIEVDAAVPVRAHLELDGTTLTGRFDVVDVDDVELIGAVPKAVARQALTFTTEGGRWRCAAVIDV